MIRNERDENEENKKCFLRRTESKIEEMAEIPAEEKAQTARQPEPNRETDARLVFVL